MEQAIALVLPAVVVIVAVTARRRGRLRALRERQALLRAVDRIRAAEAAELQDEPRAS